MNTGTHCYIPTIDRRPRLRILSKALDSANPFDFPYQLQEGDHLSARTLENPEAKFFENLTNTTATLSDQVPRLSRLESYHITRF